jgi:choline dehydrogenase-like flavoprotein
VWAFPNLFLVDGSFMPTSGGVNPSLTITANAFRVAEHIRRDFGAIAAA